MDQVFFEKVKDILEEGESRVKDKSEYRAELISKAFVSFVGSVLHLSLDTSLAVVEKFVTGTRLLTLGHLAEAEEYLRLGLAEALRIDPSLVQTAVMDRDQVEAYAAGAGVDEIVADKSKLN